MSAHEPVVSHRKSTAGSSRTFGLIFAAAFAVLAVWPVLAGARPRLWAAVIAAAFLMLAAFAPAWLSPLNRAWFHFGLALHRVVNPIVMGIIYFGTVVPIGVIMKLRGKDPLRLKRDPHAASYWVAREPPGPERGSMTRQF